MQGLLEESFAKSLYELEKEDPIVAQVLEQHLKLVQATVEAKNEAHYSKLAALLYRLEGGFFKPMDVLPSAVRSSNVEVLFPYVAKFI